MLRKLSEGEIQELTAWFEHLITVDNPADVQMPPECYRPTAAYIQMRGNGLIDDNDTSGLKPWNMAPDLIEHYVDVWYANRVGVLRGRLAQQAKGKSEDDSEGGHIPWLFGGSDE